MYCTRCGTSIAEDATFCPACGDPVSAVVPAAVPVPASATAYAGFWLRLIAWIIDELILNAALLLVAVPLAPMFFHRGPFHQPVGRSEAVVFFFWFLSLSFIGIWLYFALFESSTWQATPGKRALGLFVTDIQGRRISFPRASARFFGKILSSMLLFFGYLMAGFTAKKQALHDMLADCLVLRRI
jgi:uncharacterized RDD family membrane protein YckC